MATNEPSFLSKMGTGASLVSLICGRGSTLINQIACFCGVLTAQRRASLGGGRGCRPQLLHETTAPRHFRK